MTKNYGLLSSIALDPIEKKPLYRFYPKSMILSAGSFGCNMRCPFCQNHHISHPEDIDSMHCYNLTPKQLLELALEYKKDGNIGVAFTYNEPLMTYDYVRDTSALLHENGMKSVVVTNGSFGKKVLDEILPYVDAFNVDLKTFSPHIYQTMGGSLQRVKDFIATASGSAHVEVTTLVVPAISDSVEDMDREAAFIASLSPDIPLHITRFFPRYKMQDDPPTDIGLMKKLKEVAMRHLRYVYLGNI